MLKDFIRCLVVLIFGLTQFSIAQAQTSSPDYDIIIRGGTVFDGTGSEGRIADVGIVNDHVIAIDDLSQKTARTEKDASGLYVTPGFISIHDHSSSRSISVSRSICSHRELLPPLPTPTAAVRSISSSKSACPWD